jgi:hypothetical protein
MSVQKEYDIVALREHVRLKGDQRQLVGLAVQIGEVYKQGVISDLSSEDSAFGKIIERKGRGLTVAQYLASYLDFTRRKFFEERGIEGISSGDPNEALAGAILLDLNLGFRMALNPLLMAGYNAHEVTVGLGGFDLELSNMARRTGKDYRELISGVLDTLSTDLNEFRRLFESDKTGKKLIQRELELMRKGKVKPPGKFVKPIFILGGQILVEQYEQAYPEAERIVAGKA